MAAEKIQKEFEAAIQPRILGLYGQECCRQRVGNRMTFGIEAWSFEMGADRRVVHKAHWVSP